MAPALSTRTYDDCSAARGRTSDIPKGARGEKHPRGRDQQCCDGDEHRTGNGRQGTTEEAHADQLHHVNLCSKDVPGMKEFYRSAFRTDDIEAFKRHLEEKGVPYSDYGKWSMNGWYQIFFYDPEGNVIEVHQADD